MNPPRITYGMVVGYYDFTCHDHYATGVCPKCDYGNNCCTVTPKKDDDGFLIHCHACQDSRLFDFVIKEVANWANTDNSSPIRIRNTSNSRTTERQQEQLKKAFDIWESTEEPKGLPVETYLRERRVLPDTGIPNTLRFRELLTDPNGNPHPAMVAKVTDWQENFLGVHRTYLTKDGKRKAAITTPKTALGPIRGGSVHLGAPTDELGLTEGIETGLAVMKLFGKPVWACLGTSGLRTVQLPPEVKTVYIFADNDGGKKSGKNPGFDAAHALGARLHVEGRNVKILYPPEPRTDFADIAYRISREEDQ